MKLRDLNCRNCNGPLKQDGEKLFCAYCGGTFDIQKDSSDVEYEYIQNAEEYIRLSLERSTAALEARYKEMNAIKEEEYKLKKKEEVIKERRDFFRTLRNIIMVPLLISALFCLLLFASSKVEERRNIKNREAKLAQADEWDPGSRLTPAEFDSELYDSIREAIIDREKEDIDSYTELSGETWEREGDPKIINSYLITTENDCYLYSIVKITMRSDSGEEKDVYDCAALNDFELNSKGKVVTDLTVYKEHSSTFDFFRNIDPDYYNLKSEIIDSKINYKYKRSYVFDISDEMCS